MKVRQIRDGIPIRRRMFTPDSLDSNVGYPESAKLALSEAMHRKIARASGKTKMESKRAPRLARMTTLRRPRRMIARFWNGDAAVWEDPS